MENDVRWRNFKKGNWCNSIDTRDFIRLNYTEYLGDESFLKGPTHNTKKLWDKVSSLMTKENKNGGILDADTDIVSTINSHEAGYVDKDLEIIVGLQTDKPLKRAILPFGGIRMVEQALTENGYNINENLNRYYHFENNFFK